MSKSAAKKQKTKVVDWTTLNKAENVNSFIDNVVDKPERFVDADSKLAESVLENLKSLYDLGKELESEQMGPLKQLLTKGFDETQIWEEIQSQNRPLLKHLSQHVNDVCQQFQLEQSEFDLLTSSQLVKKKQEELNKLNKKIEQKAKNMIAAKKAQLNKDDLDENFDDLEEDEDEDGENDLDMDEDEEDENEDDTEDKFFKLDDMEKFVQQAEDEEMMHDENDDKDVNDLLLGSEDDEEGLDNLEENGEEDEEEGEDEEGFEDEELDEEDLELERALEKRARGLKEFVEDDLDEDELNDIQLDNEQEEDEDEEMEDDENEELDEDDKEAADEGFWNAGKKKKSAVSDDEEDTKPKKKSEFELKQAKTKEKIRSIEKDLIAEKPWTLIGEASAADRPQNSLLEATLDFEYATKLAPVITEEYTNEIEELIRKRIAEQLFDDVLRKVPTENKSFKPTVELDMEKSKLGLAEVYEQEYMEKVMGAEKTDKLGEEHAEIDRLFFTVCKKLDALANFHFTPKRYEADVKIKTNVPSIRMEEAVPISVSESSTLAPKEIYAPENASLKNANEFTQDDRKKMRKQKKAVNKKKTAEKEAADKLKKKLNPSEIQTNGKKDREQALKLIKEQRNTTIASKDTTASGSSTSLFKKLQEEADKKVSSIRGEKPKEQKKGPAKSATSFKM